MIKHKFNAKLTELHGIKFSSKKEANYYLQLLLRQKAGEVLFFLRQIPIHLDAGIKYIVDFQVFKSDGTVEFIDVKGMKTPIYILKKKLVENKYPFTIIEV